MFLRGFFREEEPRYCVDVDLQSQASQLSEVRNLQPLLEPENQIRAHSNRHFWTRHHL